MEMDELLEDFTFRDGLKETAKTFLDQCDSPVALHIRRTDYAKYAHHPILSLSYYEEALSKELGTLSKHFDTATIIQIRKN